MKKTKPPCPPPFADKLGEEFQMPGRNNQVARIYTLLNLLEGSSNGLTVAELYQKQQDRGHDVTQRTIRRDIEALEAAGFPIITNERSEDKQATRWSLSSRTRVGDHLVLNSRELLALFLARGALRPLSDTPFYSDLNQFFSKLEAHIGEKGKAHFEELRNEIHFEPGPKWGLGIDPDVLETVQSCCAERHVLSATYDSANSGSKRARKLGPQFLYYAKGSLYLVAEDLETQDMKIFSLARMSDAKMLDDGYDAEILNPEEFFESSFGVFRGNDPCNVKLEISAKIAPFVKERRWHSSQRVTSKGNGSILLSIDVAITPELVHWVLGFGAEAKVLEPKALREEVSTAAKRVLAYYKTKKAA